MQPQMQPQFTERQEKAWPEMIERAERHTYNDINRHLGAWMVKWDEEYRPGRGHDFQGVWHDGENTVYVSMDVYGQGGIHVDRCDPLHSDFSEDCECEFCEAERKEDEDASGETTN